MLQALIDALIEELKTFAVGLEELDQAVAQIERTQQTLFLQSHTRATYRNGKMLAGNS